MKIFWMVILIVTNMSLGLSFFGPNCVTPPLKCPNTNITFWLYTREIKYQPVELKVSEPESIRSAPWVKGYPIKILIHGYTGHKDFSPNTEIRPDDDDDDDGHIYYIFTRLCSREIIAEYARLVHVAQVAMLRASSIRTPNGFETSWTKSDTISLQHSRAASNTELVGMCTAQLIDEMVKNHDFRLPDFHVIGFSLGGQTAGFIANYLKSGKLVRITALDPAMPMFATNDRNRKIDSEDAEFVDVLHTNALAKGKLETCGDADFFANGGMDQPGCSDTENATKSGCDHARAPKYYAESILTTKGFYGRKCFSLIAFLLRWCEYLSSSEKVIFGEFTPRDASGILFFKTNSESPYARGMND